MTESRDQFVQLVLMFQMNAMQGMGKIRNPLTDRVDRNLEAAQFSIDLLDMLREKTRGNLSQTEDRLLSQVLQDLKLNYVDEAAKKESGEDKSPKPDLSQADASAQGPAAPADPGQGSSGPADPGEEPSGQQTPEPPGKGAPESDPSEGKPS